MAKITADIKGYRQLSPEEQELINRLKEEAEVVGRFVEELEHRPEVDKRWLAIARTDLQKGFMSLIRSVARPTTF